MRKKEKKKRKRREKEKMAKPKDYTIGLDIGTNSVGWVVTDDQNNILRIKGKKAIGARLFT
ncbi:hypothetical protein [Lactobacillus delbrueckii]|uniref:hypothetical protein n=1 Tax=Lactobacillus delbrueckii TaxID=1584 RepID=UPI00288A856E|nr:hypothetical protein [Lactobacillus delbrueckii]